MYFEGGWKKFPRQHVHFTIQCCYSAVHGPYAGSKGETAKQLKESLGLGKFSEQEIHDTIIRLYKVLRRTI